MEMQKIENLLLTSFEATEEQREKSPEINAAYDGISQTWEVAVRYVRDLEFLLQDFPEVEREFLIGNYAILKGTREELLTIAEKDEVLYMEAAKRLFFSEDETVNPGAKRRNEEFRGKKQQNHRELRAWQLQGISGVDSICLTREFREEEGIYGEGVYTAYLDTGIDYRHPEFIGENGESRIEFIWDQTKENGFYTHSQIQTALELPAAEGYEVVPQRDLSGHGTHVAAIGSGNSGIASRSELLIVKLGSGTEGTGKTTELMRGVNFCVNYAVERNRPLALNISYGTNYGAHNGYGILEQYLEDAMGYGRNIFVIGAGNEGVGRSHFQVLTEEIIERSNSQGGDAYEIELAVGEFQQSFSLQIWKEYDTDLKFYFLPAGSTQGIQLQSLSDAVTYSFPGMEALVYYGEPSPFSRYQEIYLDFIPNDSFLPEGIWKLYIEYVGGETGEENTGSVDLWIPVSETLSPQTGFLRPSPDKTLTIPSTATGVLTVGAFDQRFDQPASFSGRGYTWATNQAKPDIVAPGVQIVSATPGGGYTMRSGTSMATPFVTGACALFMEWGIVRGADKYLYGEKIKAYLIKGAGRLPGMSNYPNPLTGYGTLCIKESIP